MYFEDILKIDIVYYRNLRSQRKSGWVLLETPKDQNIKPTYRYFPGVTKEELKYHLLDECFYRAMSEAHNKFIQNYPIVMIHKGYIKQVFGKTITLTTNDNINILLSSDGIWLWLPIKELYYDDEKILMDRFDVNCGEACMIIYDYNKKLNRFKGIIH